MRYFAIAFEGNDMTEISPVTDESQIKTGFNSKKNQVQFTCRTTKEEYIRTVNKLLGHIRSGDIYEINYCIEFTAENACIDPDAVFKKLKSLTEAPYAGLWQAGDLILICASPERFIGKEGRKLITQPMKGTAPRGKNPAEDERLRSELFNSPKERSEHIMTVDVARNDLSRIAEKDSVKTINPFEILKLKNVHQMVSTIECSLKPGTDFRSVIGAVFPPASMTGAPKIKACRLIKKYEPVPRGFYSGAIGWINAKGDFDFCVTIRTIQFDTKENRLHFHVGSAITALSDPEREWNECLLKADSLLKALGTDAGKVKFKKNAGLALISQGLQI